MICTGGENVPFWKGRKKGGRRQQSQPANRRFEKNLVERSRRKKKEGGGGRFPAPGRINKAANHPASLQGKGEMRVETIHPLENQNRSARGKTARTGRAVPKRERRPLKWGGGEESIVNPNQPCEGTDSETFRSGGGGGEPMKKKMK